MLNFFEFCIDSKKLLACGMQEARIDDVLFSFICSIVILGYVLVLQKRKTAH